jgi:hypothetical protein
MNNFEDAKVIDHDVVKSQEVEVMEGVPEVIPQTAMDAFTRAEIDMQISTAKRFPRSVANVLRDATEMATIDIDTAESCIYHLPRAGDTIPGPSIRLAEIVGCAWGNLRYGARIIGEQGDFIVAQGVCHDLEKNTAATVEVQRRIVNKYGKKFNIDMIGVTGMAACSVALRNAILRVIPRAYVNKIYNSARTVAVGDAQTLSDRRSKVVSYFTQTLGVTMDRFLARLGRTGVEEINLADLEMLTGIKTAIKQGDAKIDEAFPPIESEKKHSGDSEAFTNSKQEAAATGGHKGRPKKETIADPSTQPEEKDADGLFKS